MIRPAHERDAETIRVLVQQAYAHYAELLGREPGPMRDDYQRRIAAGEVWVLEEDEEILGLIVLKTDPGTPLLDNVAVKPAAQGRGHGRALIAFAEQEAFRRGFSEIRLYTNVLMVKNIALYRHLGFAEFGRVREKGFERIYMAKRLQAPETVR